MASYIAEMRRQELCWEAVKFALVATIFIAACFKGYALLFAPNTLAAIPYWVAFSVVVEGTVLAYILLNYRYQFGVWIVLSCLYCALLAVALYHAAYGYSCSCFGAATPSYFSAILDVAALGLLWFFKPAAFGNHKFDSRRLSKFSSVIAGAFAAAVFLAVAVCNPAARRVALIACGFSVVPDSFSRVVDAASSGESDVRFSLFNPSSTDITLLGVNTSCSCMIATDMPLRIPPRSSTDLELKVSTGAARKMEFARLNLDRPGQPVVLYLLTQ